MITHQIDNRWSYTITEYIIEIQFRLFSMRNVVFKNDKELQMAVNRLTSEKQNKSVIIFILKIVLK